MATATRKSAEPEMKTYVVIADAINLSKRVDRETGKVQEVVRLVRGETITAPSDHQQITEFLAMGGIVEEGDTAALKKIQAKGNAKSPTILRLEDGSFRLTGAGAAKQMGAEDDPVAEAREEHIPLVATN